MIDPIRMLQDGGPFVYVVLVFAASNLVGAIAFATLAWRRRAPAWLVLLPALTPVLAAAIGTQFGLAFAVDAAANASDEVRPLLVANGFSVAFYVTLSALYGNVFTLGIAAMAAAAAVLRHRPSHDLDVALSVRGTATALAVAWAGSLAWAGYWGGIALAFDAVARASVQMKPMLVRSGIESATSTAVTFGSLGGVALLVGFGLMAVVIRGITRQTVAELTINAALVVLLLGIPALVSPRAASQGLVQEFKSNAGPTPFEAAVLDGRAISTPYSEACTPLGRGPRVIIGTSGLAMGDTSLGGLGGPIRDGMHWQAFEAFDRYGTAAVGPDPSFTVLEPLTVDVDASARWTAIRPVLAAAAGARFRFVAFTVRSGEDLCRVEAALEGPVHTTAGTRTVELEEPRDDGLVDVLFAKPGEEIVPLTPADDATMQDVVGDIAGMDGAVTLVVGASAH